MYKVLLATIREDLDLEKGVKDEELRVGIMALALAQVFKTGATGTRMVYCNEWRDFIAVLVR